MLSAPSTTAKKTLSIASCRTLMSDENYGAPALLQIPELHWFIDAKQRRRVLAEVYAQLTPLLPYPVMAMTGQAQLIRSALAQQTPFSRTVCARNGVCGDTEKTFIHNLAAACMISAVREYADYAVEQFALEKQQALLAFEPAMLVRFPSLLCVEQLDDVIDATPGLRDYCALVTTLYETAQERYVALTLMLSNPDQRATIELPANLSLSDHP